MDEKITIELAVDHEEGEEFCEWLNNRGGITAYTGTTTGNYVNGIWTSYDPESSTFLNLLWEEYCREG